MRRLLYGVALCFLWGCEADLEDTWTSYIEDTYKVVCPEAPIEIMSSKDEESIIRGEDMLNYFNIVQISDSLYYMYYEAFMYNGERDKVDDRFHSYDDFTSGIYFAYSKDCIHWVKRIPNSLDDNNLVMPTSLFISGCVVMKVSDNEYPFRMFGLRSIYKEHAIYMWKSKDGVVFEDEKMVLQGLSDTQFAGVERDNRILLYIRKSVERNGLVRKIGVVTLDFEGNLIEPIYMLKPNYVYNSAASYLNDTYDLLFPTHFDNRDGDDSAYIKSIIVRDDDAKECDCNLGDWIDNNELWMIVAPGTIKINGDTYLAYNTRTWSHDEMMPKNGVCKYKLIKIEINQVF